MERLSKGWNNGWTGGAEEWSGGVKGWSEGVRCNLWSGRKNKRRSGARGDSDRRSESKSGK